MKIIQYTTCTILLLGIFFSSCKKSSSDINFDVIYAADLDVVIPPESRNMSFNTKTTIDPLSDENVEKYANDITGYELDSLVASIPSISKNVKLVSGELSIYESSNNAVWQFSNLPLSEGAMIPLGDENGQWETVKKAFAPGRIVNVKIEGETDQGDVSFTVQVYIKAGVTASTN